MTSKPMNTSPASFAGNRSAKSKRAPKNEIIPILPKKAKLYRSEPTQGTIDYKNILLLRKFITAEGKILPRRISGLTSKQQRHMTKAIKNARVMSLLPFISQSRAFV